MEFHGFAILEFKAAIRNASVIAIDGGCRDFSIELRLDTLTHCIAAECFLGCISAIGCWKTQGWVQDIGIGSDFTDRSHSRD